MSILPKCSCSAQTAANGLIKPLVTTSYFWYYCNCRCYLSLGDCEVMRRLNLPPVVGELLAGVVLGPSLFGWIFSFPTSPHISEKPGSVRPPLGSLLVSAVLLIVTGLETDINLIIRKGRPLC